MAKLDKNRLKALFWLAVTFWIHVFERLRAWVKRTPPRGLETFRASYGPEGIWLLGPDERALIPPLGECVACRLCDSVCPSLQAEEGMGFSGPSRLVLANQRLPSAVSTWIDPFLCIRCRACDEACPQGVPLDRMIGSMRRAVAREAKELVPIELRAAVEKVAATGHLSGAPPEAPRRGEIAGKDYVYVPGCGAGAADVAAETALLGAAGLDFGTAPSLCCGAFGARATGEAPEGLRDALAAARALNVVTADPRCFERLKTEPRYRELHVLHVLEAAQEVRAPACLPVAQQRGPAVAQQRGPAGAKAAGAPRATYHDPCQLVRVPGGDALAREAIRRAGAELVEMPDPGRRAPCCGMSGGTFTFNPKLAEELGRARVRQAVATGAPVLLTQSPLCRDHLARCAALEGAKIEVKNVTELLAARAGAKPPPAAAPSGAPPAGAGPGTASHPIQHWGTDLTKTEAQVKSGAAGKGGSDVKGGDEGRRPGTQEAAGPGKSGGGGRPERASTAAGAGSGAAAGKGATGDGAEADVGGRGVRAVDAPGAAPGGGAAP